MKSLGLKKIIFFLFSILPFIVLSLTFSKIPDLIPLSFSKGRLNELGSKYNLLILPAVNIVLAFLIYLLGYKTKGEVRNINHENLALTLGSCVLLFLNIIYMVTIYITLVST